MRPLQITLFTIALVFLSTQTFRHVHVKYFAPKTSVLDQFDESIEKEIKASTSIDNLVSIYSKESKKVKEYEKVNGKSKLQPYERTSIVPYKSEYQAKEAIQTWEQHDYAIKKLRFYWTCGVLSILIGFIIYTKLDMWIGLVGVITGFSEMIFWTCPTVFGLFGSRHEFERLVTSESPPAEPVAS
jgi:molybdopterin converting factor small subunit